MSLRERERERGRGKWREKTFEMSRRACDFKGVYKNDIIIFFFYLVLPLMTFIPEYLIVLILFTN